MIKPLSCSPRGAGHYLTAEIEAVGGLPRLFPRYKVSSPVYYKGDLILNNINIQNSNVGVINTGNVESIDVSLTFLKEQGKTSILKTIFATIFTSISGFSNLLEILEKVKKLIFRFQF